MTNGNVETQEVEVEGDAVDGSALADELILAMDEGVGDASGGSAVDEGAMEIPVTKIREGMETERMVAKTTIDQSLATIVKLTDLDKDDYHLSQGHVFRTRLNTFGLPQEQLCIPQSF